MAPFGVDLNVRVLKAKIEGLLVKSNLQRVFEET